MEIIKAKKVHAKEISKLMLSDLENPHSNFPKVMINKFREHAQEKNVLQEFENNKFIAFVAIENNVVGFIVGYEESPNKAMIHYISAKKMEIKKALLNRFIKECKMHNITEVIADSFEFMENDSLFRTNNFILIKKEKLTSNLELLWYKLER